MQQHNKYLLFLKSSTALLSCKNALKFHINNQNVVCKSLVLKYISSPLKAQSFIENISNNSTFEKNQVQNQIRSDYLD